MKFKSTSRANCLYRIHLQLLLVLFSAMMLLSCSQHQVASSPEGTTTKYVEKSGVLVYAPRSARAQKVVFDSPDKQMIHEPDTPFRKFFNAHSNDFAPRAVDYAKTTILKDIVAMVENREFIRIMIDETVGRHLDSAIEPPPPVEQEKEEDKASVDLRNRNKRLLVNALYLALNRENYPDIRDKDIDRIIDSFACPEIDKCNQDEQYRKIWNQTVRSFKGDNLSLDLRLTLKEQRFFKMIIDVAIDKRRNLFRIQGSPLAPLEEAKAVLSKFVKVNVGERFITSFTNQQDSLWLAFLKEMNKETTQADGQLPVLRAPVTKDRALTDDELVVFGNALRQVMVRNLNENPDLEAAMLSALSDRHDYLRAGEKKADTPETMNKAKRDKWKSELSEYEHLKLSYDDLKTAADKLKKIKTNLKTAKQELVDTETAFETAKSNAAPALRKAEVLSNNEIDNILKNFKKLRNEFPFKKPDDSSAVAENPSSYSFFERIYALKDKAINMKRQENGDPKTPDLTAIKSKWDSIERILPNIDDAITELNADIAVLIEFQSAVVRFPEDPVTHIGAILVPNQNPNSTKYEKLKSHAETAEQRISDLIKEIDKYFESLGESPELNATETPVKNLIEDINARPQTLDQFIEKELETPRGKVKTTIAESIDPEMEAILKANDSVKDKEKKVEIATESFEKTQEGYKEAEGSETDETGTSFIAVLEAAMTSADRQLPKEEQIGVQNYEGVKKGVIRALNGVRIGEKDIEGLSEIIGKGLNEIVIKRNVEIAKKRMVETFAAVFKGYPELVASDDPIFTALLKSKQIKFGSPELAAEGVVRIPKAFKAEWSKPDVNKESNAERIKSTIEIFEGIFDKAAFSYLFGYGVANSAVLDAFKKEFYNSFKHRLSEAVSAEKEADYDYWWLTYYPKAIPLGDKSVEGQSVIEIGFPRSVTPEEQYHRWLQDQPPPLINDDDGFWEYRNRIATSVLNDFLVVLDSSNLTDKYPRIRKTIIAAIEKFSSRLESSFKKRYRNGIYYLYEQIKEEEKLNFDGYLATYNRILIQYESQELDEIEKVLFNGRMKLKDLKNILQSSADDIALISKYKATVQTALKVLKENKTIDQWEKERWKSIDLNLQDNELNKCFKKTPTGAEHQTYFETSNNQLSDLNDNEDKREKIKDTLAVYGELVGLLAYLNGKIELRSWDKYLTTFFTQKVDGEKEATSKQSKEIEAKRRLEIEKERQGYRKQAGYDLAWDKFGVEHVLYAVSSAAETGISLPFKIELYANAFFDGSRRFISPVPRSEEISEERYLKASKNINRLRTIDQYLIPFSDREAHLKVERLLILKGVKPLDANVIADRIKNFAESLRKDFPEIVNRKGFSDEFADKVLGEIREPKCILGIEKIIGAGVKYLPNAVPSEYLRYPHLWLWEARFEEMRESLRFILVNLFQTAYPGIPGPDRIKAEFSKDDGRLRALTYQWLRDLWLRAEKHNLFYTDYEEDQIKKSKKNRMEVLINLMLDRHPYITPNSRTYLLKHLPGKGNIYKWIRTVTENQQLMDQIFEYLLEYLYGPLWISLGRLEKIERQPVPYRSVEVDDFKRFRHWSKPHVQPGIQIIDMLPTSRDDLVSMSINEGGAIAKIAGQAEGAAAYDINQLRMAAEMADSLTGELRKDRRVGTEQITEAFAGIEEATIDKERIQDARELIDTSSLKKFTESFGYGASARAEGSIYARAKSAFAFSRRREYLDAAITAGGRGDSFAKWVVRKSDLRSDLANRGGKKLVAASHTGYPNGDQPFHLLVKVPHTSVQTNWENNKYICFNSAYAATARASFWKAAGVLGLAVKGVAFLANPAWWEDMEEAPVATVYPFKWDIEKKADQQELIREPNILGGRLYLDDTDKIKYSDIRTLIEAENAFIKTTRSAQLTDVNRVMGETEQQSGEFRNNVNQRLEGWRKEHQDLMELQRKNAALEKRIKELENQNAPEDEEPLPPPQ